MLKCCTVESHMTNSKRILTGDLVRYKGGSSNDTIYGVVIRINPVLGSGFITAEVLWCNSTSAETVVVSYLDKIQNLACKKQQPVLQ